MLWGFGSSDTYSTNLCSQPVDEATALQLAAEASQACGGPVEVRPFQTPASVRALLE